MAEAEREFFVVFAMAVVRRAIAGPSARTTTPELFTYMVAGVHDGVVHVQRQDRKLTPLDEDVNAGIHLGLGKAILL
jgi:hypothetical protein